MTSDAELEEKLDRLRRRVEARGAETRDRLDALGILALAEAARETFGARLVHLATPELTLGRDPTLGCPSHTAADMAPAYDYPYRPRTTP